MMMNYMKMKQISLLAVLGGFFSLSAMDPDAQHSQRSDQLVEAANNRDLTEGLNLSRRLITAGAQADFQNRYRESAIGNATQRENIELVRLLLDNGAKVDTKNVRGYTPLFLAVGRENEELILLLLDRGASLEVEDEYGRDILARAGDYHPLIKFLRDTKEARAKGHRKTKRAKR